MQKFILPLSLALALCTGCESLIVKPRYFADSPVAQPPVINGVTAYEFVTIRDYCLAQGKRKNWKGVAGASQSFCKGAYEISFTPSYAPGFYETLYFRFEDLRFDMNVYLRNGSTTTSAMGSNSSETISKNDREKKLRETISSVMSEIERSEKVGVS